MTRPYRHPPVLAAGMTPNGVKRWSTVVLLGVTLVALQGCHGCRAVDYPVSSPPSDGSGAHRLHSQSETSMVRIDMPADRERGEPLARFLVGYNDTSAAVLDAGASCWSFNPERPTLDGWARSDEFGSEWQRQEQLPVSSALRDRGVRARHGDPWLAVWNSKSTTTPSVVLYVSVAQANLPRYGGPWFLVVSRSRNGGLSFEDDTVILGPQPEVPDGPKMAIAGDGLLGLVIWDENVVPGIPFRLLWNLTEPTMSVSGTGVIHPETIADPPEPGCTFSGAGVHPRVAAGLSTMYAAARVYYSCPSGPQQRLEVYRNPSAGFALGAPWRRIISVRPPTALASSSFGILNAQDVAGPTRFGTRTDRGSSLPDLAVGQAADGEFVALVDLEVTEGKIPDEAQRERVVLFRLGRADSCDAQNHRGDLDSCGETLVGRAIDDIAVANDMTTISSRHGVWESKPAVFTGKVPDGTVDERVGVVWYTQPYKGRLAVTDEMRARTIVEAATSSDAGVTFEGPFNLTAAGADDRIPEDPAIGGYFHPCQKICPGAIGGYFGEYISGVFQFAGGAPKGIIATWGDSREGCFEQGALPYGQNYHHHVWSGAVRAY